MPRSTTPPTTAEPVESRTVVDHLAAQVEATDVDSAVFAAAAAAQRTPEADAPAPEVIATAEAMQAARAVLRDAEAEYRRMEAIAGRAANEDQLRREREEDARIAEMQADLPWYYEQAKRDMLLFRAEVVYLSAGGTMDRVMRRWIVAASTREIVRRILTEVQAHVTKRSDESYRFWDMRVQAWWELIRSATSRFRGGVIDSEDDDLEALAAANVLITEQSAEAPRGPLRREPDDRTLPGPVALGIVDRSPFSGHNVANWLPIDFSVALDEALIAAAMAQAKVVMPRSASLPPTNFPQADELARLIAGSEVKLATMRPPSSAKEAGVDSITNEGSPE